MDFSFDVVKKHPVAVGGAVVGVIFFYVILKSSKSSATQTSNPSSPTANDLSLANINAGLQVANLNTNAQLQTAAITADVQNRQTAAQLEASQLNTAAQYQLGAEQVQADIVKTLNANATQLQEAQIQGSTQVAITQSNNESATARAEAEAEALTSIVNTQTQGQVAIEQAQNQTRLAQVGLQEDYLHTLASQRLLGGSSTGVSQIASAVLSSGAEGPAAIAANQPSAAGGSPANIISSVGTVLKGLFG